MRRLPTIVTSILAALMLSMSLASCAHSPTSASDRSTAPTPTVASPDCDPAAITTAIKRSYAETAASEGTGLALKTASGVQCSQGWAVAIVSIGDGLGHDFDDREVLQRDGNDWVVADRLVVCGNPNPRKPDALPVDAQVPQPLYLIACQTD